MRNFLHNWLWIMWISLFLVGCGMSSTLTASPAVQTPSTPPTLTVTPTAVQTLQTITPAFTQTATPIPTLAVCSPLEDISLTDLPALVSNAYHPPAPGLDDPHQGVDLALLDPVNQYALSGHGVTAVLAGRVVLTLHDRFPYGNAVLIETPIEDSFIFFWEPLQLPTLAPTLPPLSALTCPPLPQSLQWDSGRRSLYTLYAHLESVEVLTNGDAVTCGQRLGKVGSSGNALNPHLHLETRVGPANATLSSMAHYDPSATVDEMASYCLWRVSDVFQRVDPFRILPVLP